MRLQKDETTLEACRWWVQMCGYVSWPMGRRIRPLYLSNRNREEMHSVWTQRFCNRDNIAAAEKKKKPKTVRLCQTGCSLQTKAACCVSSDTPASYRTRNGIPHLDICIFQTAPLKVSCLPFIYLFVFFLKKKLCVTKESQAPNVTFNLSLKDNLKYLQSGDLAELTYSISTYTETVRCFGLSSHICVCYKRILQPFWQYALTASIKQKTNFGWPVKSPIDFQSTDNIAQLDFFF